MNIEREISLMAEMTVNQLREKYEAVFGETTRTGNKQWLIKRIAWRMQANALGGLSERAKRRAAELAKRRGLARQSAQRPSDDPDSATRKRGGPDAGDGSDQGIQRSDVASDGLGGWFRFSRREVQEPVCRG